MTTQNGGKFLRFIKNAVEVIAIIIVFIIVVSLLCNLNEVLNLSFSGETPFHEALWSVFKTGASNFFGILKDFLSDVIENAKKFESWGKDFWN